MSSPTLSSEPVAELPPITTPAGGQKLRRKLNGNKKPKVVNLKIDSQDSEPPWPFSGLKVKQWVNAGLFGNDERDADFCMKCGLGRDARICRCSLCGQVNPGHEKPTCERCRRSFYDQSLSNGDIIAIREMMTKLELKESDQPEVEPSKETLPVPQQTAKKTPPVAPRSKKPHSM
jgi:hypothetical protein